MPPTRAKKKMKMADGDGPPDQETDLNAWFHSESQTVSQIVDEATPSKVASQEGLTHVDFSQVEDDDGWDLDDIYSQVAPATQETPDSKCTPTAKRWTTGSTCTPPPFIGLEGSVHKTPVEASRKAEELFVKQAELAAKEVVRIKEKEEAKEVTSRKRSREEAEAKQQEAKQKIIQEEAERKQKENKVLASLYPKNSVREVRYGHPSRLWADPAAIPRRVKITQTFRWLLSPASAISTILTPHAVELKEACFTENATDASVLKMALGVAKRAKPNMSGGELEFEDFCLKLVGER